MIEIDYIRGTIRGSCRAGDIKRKGLFKASMESINPVDINILKEME
jgi:hypothetical protein